MNNINVNIFQMKSKPHGTERFNEFVGTSENGPSFVAIGWPEIGDLTSVSKDEIRERLEKKYNYQGQQLATYLGAVNAFVNTMKKDDLVLISNHLDQVFVFQVGNYQYIEELDNDVDGMCHQREAELLIILNKADLNSELQELLRNRGTITQFKYPYERSGLKKWLEDPDEKPDVYLNELVNKALGVLEKELLSEDSMTRVTAAAEILRYAKED
ncbi:hypothetical protein CN514_04135 [Bacillus sp. AFS001701]|uniref:hypothetical protein n=1 Tax=Bacillus sp. AFS001701 TaxID=2033480 RepID=UPI000BFA2522|nr:hypothetical protein [Bacillus sp. AFS001701]PET75427.1 hypothetical protein CN514_04135 [Bacillus sp. AFS001701]